MNENNVTQQIYGIIMKEYNEFVNVLINDASVEEFFGMLEDFSSMEIMKRMEFVDRMSNDPRFSPNVIRKRISEFEDNHELMQMQEQGQKVTKVESSDIERLNAQADSMESIISVLNDDITMSPVRFALFLNRYVVNVANASYLIQMYDNVAKALEDGTFDDLED